MHHNAFLHRDFFARRPAAAPALGFVSLLLILFASCSGGTTDAARDTGPTRSYDLKGVVVSVETAEGEATIDHEEIPGYMSAMRMSFPVKDRDVLGAMEPGDLVRATMVVSDRGYWLESISLTKGGGEPPAGVIGTEPTLGSPAPAVSLVNQEGQPLRFGGASNEARVVTFIYTRCPLPDYCPLMSENFAALNRAIGDDPSLRERVRLVSVTLDPAVDTPAVLKEYGMRYAGGGADALARWDFATGEAGEIRRLAEYLGLSYKEDDGQILHSLRTAVIAPDGRLHKLYRGNEWKPAEVVADLKALLQAERGRRG